MFHLILAACLANAPGTCEPRLLPAGDAPTRKDCEMRAGPIATDWLARHPGLIAGGKARCVETAELPALDMVQIAPDIHVHQGEMAQLSPQNRGRIANLSFVVGRDRVAVIDAGGSRAEAEALYAALRRVTDKPVRYLILTHMHPDHIMGAEIFAEAGASIIADARLPEAVARRAPIWLQTIPEQIGAGAFAGTHVAAVDQTFTGTQDIRLGARVLHLASAPRAHSGNDLTVRDADTNTLFTGDLVFQGLTPSLDGSLLAWLGWLAQPPEPPPAHIVPGHGPVGEDWATATAPTVQYLTALRDATRDALDRGVALSQAVPQIVAAMQPLAPDWQDFDAITARNAASAYAELEWE